MAALEILALDTATPQIEAPQTGDTYSAPRAVSISPESLTGSTATTSLDITQTWNTTGTPTAVKVAVTDTASNAASLLADFQVGSVTQASIRKNGQIYARNNNGSGVYLGGAYNGIASGECGFNYNSNAIIAGSGGLQFSVGSIDSRDLTLIRDATDTLAQRRATNAQTFRVYNTFTNVTTNHERLAITWSSNVAYIQTEKGSTTGTLRPLVVNHGAVAFSALPTPSASIEGARAYITDSDVTTFGANVAGGGANKMPVWCDGTNWKVG